VKHPRDARDRLRKAAAGCSVPGFSRRITALRDAVGSYSTIFCAAWQSERNLLAGERTN
jgi:hypothetical protein